MDNRTINERYAGIGMSLIQTEDALVDIVGKKILGLCEKVADKYKWGIPCDFTITVFEPNVEGMTEEQLRMLIFHELLHVGIEYNADGTETYECRNLAYRERNGEQSHFWQGGKTKESELLRTSAAYKEWRLAVFTRDNFTCQKCGQKKRDIEAHHIKERCKYPELMFDVDNGLTLCHECHKETDNYGWKAMWNND